METQLQDYFNGLCCPAPVVTYNFDVDSSDWAGAGITDQASFESALGVTTSDFLLSGNNIKSNILTTTGNILDFGKQTVTNVNYITVSGLEILVLSSNQIVTFNPTIALPSSLQVLGLGDNQMTTAGYTASESWANNLHNAPSGGTISFSSNTDSATGTNLETILIAKGWTVNV
jgi:Leucine-rich repeat (LRR) protein